MCIGRTSVEMAAASALLLSIMFAVLKLKLGEMFTMFDRLVLIPSIPIYIPTTASKFDSSRRSCRKATQAERASRSR